MNIPRYLIASLVGFVFIFAYEFVVHGILLVPTYDTTPDLWRPEEAMATFFPFMLLTQIVRSFALCFLYTRHHEGKGIAEGLRFGVIVGFLFGVMQASSYAWMPISAALAGYWFISAFFEAIALGVIFSLIYKKA